MIWSPVIFLGLAILLVLFDLREQALAMVCASAVSGVGLILGGVLR